MPTNLKMFKKSLQKKPTTNVIKTTNLFLPVLLKEEEQRKKKMSRQEAQDVGDKGHELKELHRFNFWLLSTLLYLCNA